LELLIFLPENSSVTRTVDSERLWSGIEELGLLIDLLNFQVEIPTLKCSNSTMKVGFSSPLQGKTSESHKFPTIRINLSLIGKIGSCYEALKSVCTVF
jgi:hypothetical protein